MDQTWPYSARHSPPAPTVRLELMRSQVECLVDTGFSGGVLLPFPLFESLGFLSRLVPDPYQAVMPDARRLPLFTARDDVVVGPVNLRTEVHSSPSLNRRLVGRRFLKAFVAVLDGKKEQLTLS
ncbi:MAG: hypothetical protein LYZ66_00120 [Nitrososphaerales archaeon]|nr:hypothetical protein [Nitrososphaerales archaeon]